MKNTDPMEMVLRTILNFQFLQLVDEGYERGDEDVIRIVDDFFRHKFPDSSAIQHDLLPFMNLKTTLPMLAVPLCYAAKQPPDVWDELGWKISPDYDVFVGSSESSFVPSIGWLLTTLRNAVAHIPDFLDDEDPPNVSWDDGCVVRFTARRPPGSVTFNTQHGFVRFLSDFIKHTRAVSRKDLGNPLEKV